MLIVVESAMNVWPDMISIGIDAKFHLAEGQDQ